MERSLRIQSRTIKRGKTIKEDKQNAEQLLSDEKELSEHRMLVDLGRNDIHRVSRTGSSKITKLMEIEKYEHVMHIVSEVRGEIKRELSPMTVIANLLPTGTVSELQNLEQLGVYMRHIHINVAYIVVV